MLPIGHEGTIDATVLAPRAPRLYALDPHRATTPVSSTRNTAPRAGSPATKHLRCAPPTLTPSCSPHRSADMRTTTRLVTVAASVLGAALLGPAVGRTHIAEFTASLDAAQETPPIALPDAGGMGDFTLEEDGTMQATVTFQGLSGPAILAHIHQGP